MTYEFHGVLSTPDFDGDVDLVIDAVLADKRELVKFERSMIRFLARLNELSEDECDGAQVPQGGDPQTLRFDVEITADGAPLSGYGFRWNGIQVLAREFMRAGLEGVALERSLKPQRTKRGGRA